MTDDFDNKYSLVCDAIERIFFHEKDGIVSYDELLEDVDGLRHTSTEARRAAVAVFAALDLDP